MGNSGNSTKAFRRTAAWLAVIVMAASACPVHAEDSRATNSVTTGDVFASSDERSYVEYRAAHANQPRIAARIDGMASPGNPRQELDGSTLSVADEGEALTFAVTVAESGLYNLGLTYYPLKGHGLTMEFSTQIDGAFPFSEAQYGSLYRVWKDVTAPGEITDTQGNDLTPSQEEAPELISAYLQDNTGVFDEAYEFYLTAGQHIVRLTSTREPLAIKELWLQAQSQLPAYVEVQQQYQQAGYTAADAQPLVIEAEQAARKSESVLYGRNDRSSALTTPYSASGIKINTIGGSSWATQGQWIEWTVKTETAGLYRLSLRARQNQLSGSFVTRKLYIDGNIPFAELADIRVKYSMNWQKVDLPYDIYLSEGEHTLRMEVTVGALSELVAQIEQTVRQLNYAYRQIVMITGTNPDTYRDYQLEINLPEIFTLFEEQAKLLEHCDAWLLKMTGKRGSMNGILQTLSRQLRQFVAKPEVIQKRLSTFKDNIGALGSWLVNIKQQSLELDKLYIRPSDSDGTFRAEANPLEKIIHESKLFFYSFITDYDLIGDMEANDTFETIDVWAQAGRDQANIIKQRINNDFTPHNGIQVNLKLVQGQLMAATAAGRGPDVVLQLGNSEPVNYAVRGASVDLTQFADYKQVASRFRESALVPYMLEDGVYALPETQTFSVLFYRTDVLKELNLVVPDTWGALFQTLGRLQKNNMTMGIQPPNSAAGSFTALSTMAMLLYQRGGELYSDHNTRSGLSSEAAEEAFELWVSLYEDYELPTRYDALNRFRSGEMPLVVEDFTFYNLLSVAAPEIRGMWSFTHVPGTVQPDGSVNYSVSSTGICCMMLSKTNTPGAAWTFMKWWTDADTQSAYGQEIESQLGVSARYPSANKEAFSQMAWAVDELNLLNSQWVNVQAIPEVPGGYFTSRHLNNAFRRVLSYSEDPRETLLDYVTNIDNEIAAKRREFRLGSNT